MIFYGKDGELTGPDREHEGLSPLLWPNINPYGRFRLDMGARIDLAGGSATIAGMPSAGAVELVL